MITGRKAAFTLIELLVVLAIAAILASLLFGAASRISASALNARCTNHLRLTGSALFKFASDHNGRIPGRSYNDGAEDIEWHRVLINKGYVEAVARPPTGNGTRSSPILYCPAFDPTGPTVSIHAFRRYGMRVWAPRGEAIDDSKRLLPLVAISNPADFFLLADSYYTVSKSQGYQVVPGSSTWRIHLRHGKSRAHAFFADGHVEAKDGAYFENLHLTQSEYGGTIGNRPFGIQEP